MNFFDAYNAGDLLWLGDWSPTWLVLLGLLGLTVIVVSAYDLRTLPPVRRWVLVALRTAVYALAVALLLEPAVDLKHVSKVKNHVAFLVDSSRTMTLKTDGDASRYERVAEAVGELDPVVERRKDEHKFSTFSFDSDLSPASRHGLRDKTPDGDATDLTGALREVRKRFESRDLGGVVLFSDGIDTGAIGRRVQRGEELDETTRSLLEELDAPINAMSASGAEGMKDVAVAEVKHDDFAFVHNKVSIDVVLQVVGMGRTSFPVTLSREGKSLQTREVTVRPDETRYELSFEFVPQSIGKELYTVSVPEFAGEALHSNNVSHFLQTVIRDKIRVLQVVGRPSWDERFLRRLLKKNPNVDLISFFILRTNENVQLVPPSELSLIPFPTRELFEDELGSFDLVVFQNFNFGPYNMHRYLSSISKYVKDGGGFVMVGGNLSFASGGYAHTPIADILPVELPSSEDPSMVLDTQQFRPELTEFGTRHPITQMAFDPESNRKIWRNLPKMRGTNIVSGAKPHATVLARHPSLESGGEKMPVITISEKGDGRVMALTSDSTWRWGFKHVGQGGTPREYQVFWNSAMRWLIKDPELKLIKVDIPEEVYPPGEKLRANIRISKPDYTPAKDKKGTVELLYRSFEDLNPNKGPTGQEQVGSWKFKTDHNGKYTAKLPVEKPGIYTVVATATTSAGKLEDRDIVLSVPDVQEFRNIVPRDDLMAKFASHTGGYSTVLPDFDPSELKFKRSQRVQVNRRKVIHLWDSFVVFVLILGLLTTEWTLRRRWGRL